MRVSRMFKKGGVTRTLPCALALFTILAMFIAVSIPVHSVVAQDAAESRPVPEGSYRPLLDFTGDTRTDFANVVQNATGTPINWKILRNPADPAPGQAFIRVFDYGVVGDALTPQDFIGDGKTDIAIWRAGNYYIVPFPEGTGPLGPFTYFNWGNTSPSGENMGRDGDYDGDGKDDGTILRLASGTAPSGGRLTWFIRGSGGVNRAVQFGQAVSGRNTLAFQGADFTGDGRDELVMATASTATGQNTYWIGDSITGNLILTVSWGNFITDYFISPDDYTGDGLADIVAYRGGGANADAGAWYIRDTATGQIFNPVIFGIPDPTFENEDIPIRGNFDGDNRADIAVFRRSTAEYFWINSSNGSIGGQQWGDPALTNTPGFLPPERPLGSFFTF